MKYPIPAPGESHAPESKRHIILLLFLDVDSIVDEKEKLQNCSCVTSSFIINDNNCGEAIIIVNAENWNTDAMT